MGNKRKKKKSKKQERRYLYFVFFGVFCLCVIAVIIAVAVNRSSDSKNQTSVDTDSGTTSGLVIEVSASDDETQTEINEQAYNSVDDLVMDKTSKEVALNISNAESNSYSLMVTVELEGGETLYVSELIAPGETLGTVVFDTDIAEGEYSVKVSVDSYSSEGELANGVIYTRTLTVE